jgi:hypothetical protein
MNLKSTVFNSKRNYLIGKIELFLLALVFISVFFQIFPYYEGKFLITYYFSTIAFVIVALFQILNFEGFHFNKSILLIYFFFSCLLMYGLVSIFFSQNQDDGFRHLHLRFMSFFIFYVITQVLKTKKRIKIYEFIILVCVVWNIGVCVWEIATLQHLPVSKFHDELSFIPTGSFNNENDLPAILLLCCSILFFMKGKFLNYISITIMLILFIIMGVQGSRLVMLTLFPFLLYKFLFKTSKLYKLTVILLVSLIVSYIFINYPLVRFLTIKRIKEHVLSFGFEAKSQRLGSTSIRKELYVISLEKFSESYGFGVGTGNFEKTNSPQRLISTNLIIVPHSIFFETVATEGFIGLFFLCVIVFSSLLPLINNESRKSIFDLLKIKLLSENEKQLLVFMLFFIVSVSVPASIRSYFIYWNILGYYYCLMYVKDTCESDNLMFKPNLIIQFS